MKPYGREKTVKGLKWKRDYHPKGVYINWWEDMCDFFSRSRIKHNLKKQINNEIIDEKIC